LCPYRALRTSRPGDCTGCALEALRALGTSRALRSYCALRTHRALGTGGTRCALRPGDTGTLWACPSGRPVATNRTLRTAATLGPDYTLRTSATRGPGATLGAL
jgi:hypothetical protein